MTRSILLSMALVLLAPVARASPPGASPSQQRVQETVAARAAHQAVRQQEQAVQRRLDLERQRAHAAAKAARATASGSN